MKILIIEDNELIVKAITRALQDHFVIDLATEGPEGLALAQSRVHDVILLDLNLPEMSGQQICSQLRRKGIETPIIILSGRDDIKDKVELLDMGADDYVTKPFNMVELRSRINVAMRHFSAGGSGKKLVIADLELDPIARTVHRSGNYIGLRRKEFDLLELLMLNKGRTLTRRMILEHIWDANETLWANVVDVHIKHLRDKVDRPYSSRLIHTVHGLGYKLEPAISNSRKEK